MDWSDDSQICFSFSLGAIYLGMKPVHVDSKLFSLHVQDKVIYFGKLHLGMKSIHVDSKLFSLHVQDKVNYFGKLYLGIKTVYVYSKIFSIHVQDTVISALKKTFLSLQSIEDTGTFV